MEPYTEETWKKILEREEEEEVAEGKWPVEWMNQQEQGSPGDIPGAVPVPEGARRRPRSPDRNYVTCPCCGGSGKINVEDDLEDLERRIWSAAGSKAKKRTSDNE